MRRAGASSAVMAPYTKEKPRSCASIWYDRPSWWISSVPAATSCSDGFHTWYSRLSTSVTLSGPSLRPSLQASSSPPAPPPTITISLCKPASVGRARCRAHAGSLLRGGETTRHGSVVAASVTLAVTVAVAIAMTIAVAVAAVPVAAVAAVVAVLDALDDAHFARAVAIVATVADMLAVARHIRVRVPLVAHEQDRTAAGAVAAAELGPVLAVARRHAQVDRFRHVVRRRRDDHRLRRVHDRTRDVVADVDPAIEAGLPDADGDIGLRQGRKGGGAQRHAEDQGFHGMTSL
ncbi:conserved hypothetical protein [Ricinus communis]|uniref:Uncharacterized protein n=1 Tax=Ricinus communis TaxID=3988 RepID=B9TI96_RICCO|nr:conserved hypothetical protein [Ricinus communis]